MHVTCKEHGHLQISNIANTYGYIHSRQLDIVENTYITKSKKLTTVTDTHRPMRIVEHVIFSE